MKKVLRSKHPNTRKDTVILICKHKAYPAPGSAIGYIGRQLDGSRKPPPVKSFKLLISKPLSPMILRLWETIGVPKTVYEKYKKESLSPHRRNHSWLPGVAVPTNSLPLDTVFVPGMKSIQPSYLFVTRSPCYAYDHGRLIQNVTSRPEKMSQDDWDWLTNRNFGPIIFSNPRHGKKSIPERIANGDLDGDLYLVCWDKVVLSHMKNTVPLGDETSNDNGILSTMPPNVNWFQLAQKLMADYGQINDMGRLTGVLYRLAEKKAKVSDLLLKDPDANALFEAFNQALEFKKHGRPISLPDRLHVEIPVNLQYLLESTIK